jgi:lysophospholipase L1-like esterase
MYTADIKKKGVAINVSLSIATVLLCLLVAEVAFRQISSLKTYTELNSNSQYKSPYQSDNKGPLLVYTPGFISDVARTEFTVHVRANSIGLNDKEHTLKTDSAKRICVIGDSFTEGFGSTGDSTYPKLLQKMLTGTEVMGCGISGSDPIYEYQLLKDKLLQYHPNVVIVALTESDINDIMVRGGLERFNSNGNLKSKKAPWWEPLFAHSYLVRFWVIKVLQKDFFFLSDKERKTETEKSALLIEQALDKTHQLCKDNNIKCLFIFLPGAGEIRMKKLKCEPILQYAQNQGYNTLDVLAYFQNNGITEANVNEYFWHIDGHNNNKGYQLIAESIKEVLTTQ